MADCHRPGAERCSAIPEADSVHRLPEGWALYTEWLAKRPAGYEGDPFGDLGRLQAEVFRAVRLVVDTGIHAKRWPREQAIGYMREKTGMGEKEVTAEIERYIVNPGQACAYKIGMLKMRKSCGARANRARIRSSTSANSTMSCSRTAPCRSRSSRNRWRPTSSAPSNSAAALRAASVRAHSNLARPTGPRLQRDAKLLYLLLDLMDEAGRLLHLPRDDRK